MAETPGGMRGLDRDSFLEWVRGRAVLTTGQVGRICNVAPRTVSKWMDSGRMRCYRIPGSLDRRVSMQELKRFLRDNSMPEFGLSDLLLSAVLVSQRVDLILPASEILGSRWTTAHAQTAVEAGMACAERRPDLIVADGALGVAECLGLLRSCQSMGKRPVLVVLYAEDDGPERWRDQGFCCVDAWPGALSQLAEAARHCEKTRDEYSAKAPRRELKPLVGFGDVPRMSGGAPAT